MNNESRRKNDLVWMKKIHYDFNGGYLCNQVCNAHSFKKTKDKKKVTCINCLRRISENKSQGIYEKDRVIIKKEERKKYKTISDEDIKILKRIING